MKNSDTANIESISDEKRGQSYGALLITKIVCEFQKKSLQPINVPLTSSL